MKGDSDILICVPPARFLFTENNVDKTETFFTVNNESHMTEFVIDKVGHRQSWSC